MSATVMKYVFERRTASKSPFTYLLSLKRQLKAETMAKNIIELNLNADDDDTDEPPREYIMNFDFKRPDNIV